VVAAPTVTVLTSFPSTFLVVSVFLVPVKTTYHFLAVALALN
jgi:hypothetical protein